MGVQNYAKKMRYANKISKKMGYGLQDTGERRDLQAPKMIKAHFFLIYLRMSNFYSTFAAELVLYPRERLLYNLVLGEEIYQISNSTKTSVNKRLLCLCKGGIAQDWSIY